MNRKTPQRDAILKAVKSTSSHPGAGWIYRQVRREISNISLGTVYRNLQRLVESGHIRRFDSGGLAGFINGNCNSHFHIRCDRCGCIVDIDEPVDHSIEAKAAAVTGFRITGCNLEICGLCPACQQAEVEESHERYGAAAATGHSVPRSLGGKER